MKKVVSVILALILAVSMPGVAADTVQAADPYVRSENFENMAGLLRYLEIINTNNITGNMTRGAFTQMLCCAAGLKDFVPDAPEQVFSDVAADSPFAGAVQLAKQRGYISGYSDGTFRPEDEITLMEAGVCLLNVLGYGAKASAMGYPNGYYSVISDINLRKGISSSYGDKLSMACAVHLIYNALHAEPLQVIGVQNGRYQYGTVSGETLLYTAFQIQVAKGVVNGVDVTSLSGENDLPPYSIYVGEKILYAGDMEVYSKLGCYVTAYYSDHKSRDFLRYLEADASKNEDVVLPALSIIKAETGKVTIEDENGKEKSYSFDKFAPVIYNSGATEAAFDLSLLTDAQGERLDGTVTLRDNNADGRAEVILVDVYEDIIAGQIDTVNEVVHDYYDYSRQVSIAENSLAPRVVIYDSDGDEVAPSAIKRKNSLQVYRSREDAYQPYVKIYVSSATVSGTFDMHTSRNGETIYQIDGKEYGVSGILAGRMPSPILGRAVVAALNRNGKIADLNYDSSSGYQWGLLTQYAVETGIDEGIKVQIFGLNGAFSTYPLADKIKVDGKPYEEMKTVTLGDETQGTKTKYAVAEQLEKAAAAIDASMVQAPGRCQQMIKFGTNKNGEINYIDTLLDGLGEKTQQEKIEPENEVYYGSAPGVYQRDNSAVSNKVIVADSAAVFQYPADLVNEEEYAIVGKSFFQHGDEYKVLYYFGDSKEKLTNEIFMTTYTDNLDAKADQIYMSLVEKRTQIVGDSGEIEQKLYLYTRGNHETILAQDGLKAFVQADETAATVNDLEPGDIIYYSRNSLTGKLSSFMIRYKFSEDRFDNAGANGHHLSVAYPYAVRSDAVKWVPVDAPEAVPEAYKNGSFYLFKNSAVPICIFDSKKGGGKVKTGSYLDLADYESAGENCTKMLIHYHFYLNRAIAVYIYR